MFETIERLIQRMREIVWAAPELEFPPHGVFPSISLANLRQLRRDDAALGRFCDANYIRYGNQERIVPASKKTSPFVPLTCLDTTGLIYRPGGAKNAVFNRTAWGEQLDRFETILRNKRKGHIEAEDAIIVEPGSPKIKVDFNYADPEEVAAPKTVNSSDVHIFWLTLCVLHMSCDSLGRLCKQIQSSFRVGVVSTDRELPKGISEQSDFISAKQPGSSNDDAQISFDNPTNVLEALEEGLNKCFQALEYANVGLDKLPKHLIDDERLPLSDRRSTRIQILLDSIGLQVLQYSPSLLGKNFELGASYLFKELKNEKMQLLERWKQDLDSLGQLEWEFLALESRLERESFGVSSHSDNSLATPEAAKKTARFDSQSEIKPLGNRGASVDPEEYAQRKLVTERWEHFRSNYKSLKYKRASFGLFAEWAAEKFDDMPSDDETILKAMIEAYRKTPLPKKLAESKRPNARKKSKRR